MITFQTPSTYYDHENYQIAFWEKLILSKETRAFTAKAQIHYIDPLTRVLVDREEIIPLTVSYPVILRATNTGLIAVFGVLFLILLGFLMRPKKHPPLRTRTTHQTFEEIELMVQEELNKQAEKRKRARIKTEKVSTSKKPATKHQTSKKSPHK